MMKRDSKSVFYVLMVTLAILAILAVPVSAAKLATPTLIYPLNNFHSYTSNPDIFFTWKPVPGATTYNLQFQKKSGADWTPYGTSSTFYLYYTKTILGGTYRWRLYANNSNPADTSNPTAWRTFTVGSELKQLPTPMLVGPPSGITFYHVTPRIFSMDWKAVLGADQYVLDVQYFDPATDDWLHAPTMPRIILGTHHPVYIYSSFPGAYKGRWCVQAQDSTGSWFDSNPTAWRTFTFKN